MDRLKKLELNKLVHELEFIRSDYQYKSEMIQEADKEFINSVNKIIESHSDLKELYEEKLKKNYDRTLENFDIESEEVYEELEPEEVEDPKLKSLYRKIVKLTHPDKIGTDVFNNVYIESTKYYQEKDIISIYQICDKLNIDYEFEDNDYFLIQNKISEIKERIKFLETTFTWLWINTEESQREQIILNFIKSQLILGV